MSEEATEEVGGEFAVGDYEVEVVPEGPVQAEEVEASGEEDGPTEEELGDVSERVKKRIDKLTWRYNEEKREREAALAMREEAINYAKSIQSENERMRQMIDEGSNVLVAEIRNRTQAEVNIATAAYRSALEVGDPDAIAKAQADLNKAQIEASQVDNLAQPNLAAQQPGAAQLAYNQGQQAPPAQQAPVAPQGSPQGPQDPAFLGWQQDNPWFNVDKEKTDVAVRAHEELVRSAPHTGMIIGSVAYYNQIDKKVREAFPSSPGAEDNSESAAGPAPPVVAPAARTNSGTGGKSPRKLQLTERQAHTADRLGVPRAVYALELAKLPNGGQ